MFYYVEFLETTPKGPQVQVVMGRAILDPGGDEVRFEGIPQDWVEEMQRDGINIGGGRHVFPNQGMEFLSGLRIQYTGSHIRATDVKESSEPPAPPVEQGVPDDRQGTEMFRLVNGKKEDADLWDAILGDDVLPSDRVLGEDAPGPRKPAR